MPFINSTASFNSLYLKLSNIILSTPPTLITSLTTLLVLLSLYFLGGELIKNFSLALILGVIVGTYSSIYIASNALMIMGLSSDHLIQEKRENEDFDGLP